MRPILILLLALLLGACLGCGSPGGDYGDACGRSSDCQDGLLCPASGPYQGHCTIMCDLPDPCPIRFGADSFCHVQYVCVSRCSTSSQCPAGMRCETAYTPDYCVAN